jgi:hypothetical protein
MLLCYQLFISHTHYIYSFIITVRMKRRKGQFAGRADFGDVACSSATHVSTADGEDDHFRETQ